MHSLSFACLIAVAVLTAAQPVAAADQVEYPKTRRENHADVYHGTRVDDPYRWLEADVRTSPEVAEWVAAENKITSAYLDSIPQRGKIRRLDQGRQRLLLYAVRGASAGHGGGKPVSKRIEEITDEWAFLVKNLGMKP
jgi:prolyl oligopeptidase